VLRRGEVSHDVDDEVSASASEAVHADEILEVDGDEGEVRQCLIGARPLIRSGILRRIPAGRAAAT
jgi:hypothetical protein